MNTKNLTLIREMFLPSLEEKISDWMTENCEEDEWESVGWVGDKLSLLMAHAAMNVLLASKDVQNYLEKEGMLNES